MDLGAAAIAGALEKAHLDPAHVSVTSAKGFTEVAVPGGMHEFTAGHPDLPWVSERVDLPEGMRVTGVEVVSLATQPLRDGVLIAAAPSTQPGAGPGDRSTPDAKAYAAQGFVPAQVAALGFGLSVAISFLYYGIMRATQALGHNGALHPYVAAWSADVLFGVIAVTMLVQAQRR